MQNRAGFPGTGGSFVLSLYRRLAPKHREEKFVYFEKKKVKKSEWKGLYCGGAVGDNSWGEGDGGSFGLDENTGFGPSFGAGVTPPGGFGASFVLT